MRKNALLILVSSALLSFSGCGAYSEEASSSASFTVAPESSSSVSFASSSESLSSSLSPHPSSESSEEAPFEPSASSEHAAKEFNISIECDEGAKVTFLEEKAPAGKEVHFSISLLDGFSLKEASARAGSGELELTKGLDGDYSFAMPSGSVLIKVATSRKSYRLSLSDPGGFLKSVKQKKAGSNSYSDLDLVTAESEADEEGEAIPSSYKAAEFGAEILLSFNVSVDQYELTGIAINGVASPLDPGCESYSFLMKAEEMSVSLSYSYKSVAFELIASEHIALSLFADSSCEKEIKGSYIPYETVYLKATPNREGYGVKTLTCTYASSSGGETKKDLISLYDEDTGLYSFTYPMASGVVRIALAEYDLHAYDGASFVGDYLNLDLSYGPSKDYGSFTEKSSLKILGSGDLVYARTETSVYSSFSIASYEEKDGTGLIQLQDESSYALPTLAYSRHLLVFDTYLKSPVSSSSDLVVALKKEKEGGDYSLQATQFKIGEVTYALACFFEGGAPLESILIERSKGDYARNAIHFGVDVELLEGDAVSEEKAIFRVQEGGTALLSVGYVEEGGAKNRVALGEEFGTYADGEGKILYLNGSGSATYDGESYGYSLDEDGATLTLSSNGGTIGGTIDKASMSFALSKKEEASMPWMGKTYKGTPQYSSSDDDTSYSFAYSVTFSSEGCTLSWMEFSFSNYVAEGVAYEVENGNSIKTKFYNCGHTLENSSGASLTLTYHASGDYFTAKGGYNGAYFQNTKLSLVS